MCTYLQSHLLHFLRLLTSNTIHIQSINRLLRQMQHKVI